MNEINISNQKFITLIGAFKTELEKENKSKEYVESHVNHITECLTFCERNEVLEVTQIKQELIDRYIKHLEEERINYRRGGLLCTGTINKQKNSIRLFWKFLELEGYKVYPIELIQK